MGYSQFYQAIPEQSVLYRRLQWEPKLECVFRHLYPQGSRPLDLRECGPEIMEDIADHVAKNSSLFFDRQEVAETMTDLLDLVDKTCLNYPGLIDRVVFNEKSLEWIEERLAAVIPLNRLTDRTDLSGQIFAGDAFFTDWRTVRGQGFDPFTVVSSQKVRNVADLLRDWPEDRVFATQEGFFRSEYLNLRGLYLKLAELGEAILVD